MEAKSNSASRLLKGFSLATAGILSGVGLMMLYAATSQEGTLKQPEAMFGLSNWAMLMLMGCLHLILSGYLFMTQDLMNCGFMTLWMGINYLVYRGGMVWVMKKQVPFPAVNLVGWKLGVSPSVADTCWKLLIAYLIMGGLLELIIEGRRLEQLKKAAFEKHWRETRNQGVTTSILEGKQKEIPIQPALITPSQVIGESEALNQTPMPKKANVPQEFKFFCPNCGQHIQCNSGYSGRQIVCPGCQNQILVPQPTTK